MLAYLLELDPSQANFISLDITPLLVVLAGKKHSPARQRCAEILIDACEQESLEVKDIAGNTALHYCVRKFHQLYPMLAARAPALTQVRNDNGITAEVKALKGCNAYLQLRREWRSFRCSLDVWEKLRLSSGEFSLNLPDDKNAYMYLLRSAIITLSVLWEGFVHSLLEQAFELLLGEGGDPAVPASPEELTNRFGRQYLESILQKVPIGERFEYYFQADSLARLLRRHKASTLAAMGTPLLSSFRSAFEDLFGGPLEPQLASEASLLEFHSWQKQMEGRFASLSLQSERPVAGLIRLIYGGRCVFAHGVASPTINTGALSGEANFDCNNQAVSDILLDFWRRLRDKKAKCDLSLRLVENLGALLMEIAHRTTRCVALATSAKLQNRIIWGQRVEEAAEDGGLANLFG